MKDVVAVIVWLLLLVTALCRGAFVDESVAFRALEAQGYSNIRIIESSWMLVQLRGCGSSDAAKFTASVTNPAGHPAVVFVCSGWLFKGATVRS